MDDSEFEELVVVLHAAVHAYAARRTDPHTADDVAAETFAAVWRRRAAAPSDSTERRAWVFGFARHVLAHAQRAKARQLNLGVRMHAAVMAGLPIVEPDVAERVVDSHEAAGILRRLSPRDVEVLGLVVWDGLSPAEAAAVLGCSVTALTTRLMRVRRHIAALLRAHAYDVDHDLNDEDRRLLGGATEGGPG